MGAIPIQWLTGYLAGALVVLAAREPLSKTWEPLRTRYFTALLLFAASAHAPAGAVLYGLFPDWSWMYLVNPAQVPALLGLLVVLAGGLAAPVVGFFVTHRLMRRRPHLLHWTLGSILALAFVALIGGWGRLSTVAYYDAFHYGGAKLPLSGSPLLIALLFVVPAVSGTLVFTLLMVRRHIEQAHRVSRAPA